MALTSKQRAALRGAANTMDPVYQIGKGEIDDTLKQGIADCIAARELIKIKVLENSEYDPREAADILCEALDCDCVQVIGRKFVLFKQKKKKKGPSLYEKMLGMQAEQQGQQGADSNIKKSANLKSTQNIEYSGNSKGGIASKANALNKNKGGK